VVLHYKYYIICKKSWKKHEENRRAVEETPAARGSPSEQGLAGSDGILDRKTQHLRRCFIFRKYTAAEGIRQQEILHVNGS